MSDNPLKNLGPPLGSVGVSASEDLTGDEMRGYDFAGNLVCTCGNCVAFGDPKAATRWVVSPGHYAKIAEAAKITGAAK